MRFWPLWMHSLPLHTVVLAFFTERFRMQLAMPFGRLLLPKPDGRAVFADWQGWAVAQVAGCRLPKKPQKQAKKSV